MYRQGNLCTLCEPILRARLETYLYSGLRSLRNFLHLILQFPELGGHVFFASFKEVVGDHPGIDWAAEGEERDNNIDLFTAALRKSRVSEGEHKVGFCL